MRLLTRVCLSLSLVLAFSGLVKADPIRISSGSIAQINLSSASFDLTDTLGNSYIGGTISNGVLPRYDPGSVFNPVVNLFETFGRQDFRGVYNDGTRYEAVYNPFTLPPSSMTFTSSGFQLPGFDDSIFSVTIPFTMQGLLTPVGECVGNPSLCNFILANNNIYGNGSATYIFYPNLLSQDGKWQLTRIDYAFGAQTPEPTPEPATLLLLGAGLAGLIGYSRRSKRKVID